MMNFWNLPEMQMAQLILFKGDIGTHTVSLTRLVEHGG